MPDDVWNLDDNVLHYNGRTGSSGACIRKRWELETWQGDVLEVDLRSLACRDGEGRSWNSNLRVILLFGDAEMPAEYARIMAQVSLVLDAQTSGAGCESLQVSRVRFEGADRRLGLLSQLLFRYEAKYLFVKYAYIRRLLKFVPKFAQSLIYRIASRSHRRFDLLLRKVLRPFWNELAIAEMGLLLRGKNKDEILRARTYSRSMYNSFPAASFVAFRGDFLDISTLYDLVGKIPLKESSLGNRNELVSSSREQAVLSGSTGPLLSIIIPIYNNGEFFLSK